MKCMQQGSCKHGQDRAERAQVFDTGMCMCKATRLRSSPRVERKSVSNFGKNRQQVQRVQAACLVSYSTRAPQSGLLPAIHTLTVGNTLLLGAL